MSVADVLSAARDGEKIMMITVIGRGHSGTRAISNTLSESGVFMGSPLNNSWDWSRRKVCMKPAVFLAEVCGLHRRFDLGFFKGALDGPDPAFVRLIEDYLSSVLNSDAPNKGWKIPETTLCYPWILKMFPDMHYIHWVRDPRDCILGGHVTDELEKFNIDYPETGNIREKRAISWQYQPGLMKATRNHQAYQTTV